jgi:methyl-accepting chemotaxis protein
MNLTRYPVALRVAMAFGAVVLTIAALVVALHLGFAKTAEQAEHISDQIGLQKQTAQVKALAQENATAALVLLVTQSPELQQQLAQQIGARNAEMAKVLAAVQALVKGQADDEALASNAAQRQATSAAGVQRIVQLVKDGKQAEASFAADEEMIPMMAPLQQALFQLDQRAAETVASAQAASAKVAKQLRALAMAAGAMAVALALVMGYGLARSVTRPLAAALQFAQRLAGGDLTARIQVQGQDEFAQLNQALNRMSEGLTELVMQVRADADQIATGSAQIASGSADLSSRSEQQAANLEHTASSMEELAATVNHNAHTAERAAALATATRNEADAGGRLMDQVVHTMDDIATGSQRIVEITAVIDGLAFQTNILALNAAVEAARAGEQGRGFAVVAAEVRTLAQRSAAAAREVRTLLEDSATKITSGAGVVGQAGKSIQSTVQRVNEVSTLIAEIADATRKQTAGIGAVNQAVGVLDDTTQRNAALVEEAAASADSLSQRAQHLAETVRSFKLTAEAV